MKRVKRNCSTAELCKTGFSEFKKHLENRLYNSELINEAIKETNKIPRDILIGLKSPDHSLNSVQSSKKYPLCMKFNPKLPPMSKFIKQHMHILGLTAETSKLFNKNSLFVSYKMERNILSLITRNRFRSSVEHPHQALGPSAENDDSWGCFICDKTVIFVRTV